MNAHTPFDANQDWSNPYCQNRSNDPMVDALLGNAYHVVRTVYCNLGNLKLLYDLLNQYGMVLGVNSEDELKALTTDAKYARIYGFSRAGDHQVTDYLYVEGDRTGILPNDATATGSWITVATSGSNGGGTSSGEGAYIPWVYANGSATGGETTINVPDGTVGVPFIIVNGDMQYVGRGFEFDIDSLSVTLAQPLEQGDEVVFLLTGVPAVPDNPNVNDWIQINWLYNNGAAVGGEQVIAIPYTFQSIPAVYKNGLRLYKGLSTESYTADPDNQRIFLTEPLTTNDRLIVTIGGESETLFMSDRTIQEVARSANVKDTEIILSTNTTQYLNGMKIIYDVVAQKIYGLPSLPTNVYIGSVSNGQLTYNPGSITVDLLPVPDPELQALEDKLESTEGASSINTSDGDSVQVHLDAIKSAAQATTNLIKETNSVIPPDYSRQLIIGVTDREGEASAEIRADAGKGETRAFPQCIATDPVTGEFFITRGWDATSPVYVHIYDRNFNFLKVVRAGGGWGEGIVIGYVNGERRIAVSRASAGYAVYSLPATEDITGLNSATLLFEQTSANQEAQLSSYGNYVTVRCSHLGDDQYIRRSLYSVYNLQEFLTTPDPVRKSFIHFPSDQMSGGVDTNFLVTKCQATCLSPRGMAGHNGQTWATTSENRELPGFRLRFIEVSHGGDVITNQLLHPEHVIAEYTNKGWTRPAGQALDNTEPEGICYSNEYGYVWLTVISERVFITTQYNPVLAAELDSNRNLDLRAAALPQSNNPGSVRSVSANAPVDDTSGIPLTTPDQIVDMMRARNLRHYSCTLRNGLTFGSASFTGNYNMAEFTLIDGNQCIATITLDRSTVHQFFASGNTPRIWAYGAVLQGGTTADQTNGRASMLQIAPNNFGQIRVVTGSTANHTPMRFVSNQTAEVGSITMTSTATAFNTTSDERLKDLHGDVPDALDIIQNMIDDGAVQMAAFKLEPEKVYPMLVAQRVAKSCDYAVTKGEGEYGEEGFIPDMVDYSKLVPLLFAAIMQLKAKLDGCESK